MTSLKIWFLLLLFICCPAGESLLAQGLDPVFHSDGKYMTLKIDKRKPNYPYLMEAFGLQEDSLFLYGEIGQLSLDGWVVQKIKRNVVVLSMPLFGNDTFDWFHVPVFGETMAAGIPGYPTGLEAYGVNNLLRRENLQTDSAGMTRFFLEGYETAHTVVLSGHFNDWSTGLTPMQKVSGGWEVRVLLPEGKNLYKFIVDGTWVKDPNNRQEESDGYGGLNSVYYTENHVFTLSGFTDARRVVVTGSFNGWNERELNMQATPAGWQLPVYLRAGTITYKFLVDGKWMTDPGNPKTLEDGEGNLNSVYASGYEHRFYLSGYEQARDVVLSGSFNQWRTAELRMQRVNGGWELPYRLAPGNYEYKFIVDGQWMQDPANPQRYGTDANGNSLLSIEPNYTFVLQGYENAQQVTLSGSFNGWANPGYAMRKEPERWVYEVYLPKGKVLYKFTVDGTWIDDPANALKEPNEYGEFNSVLWMSLGPK